MPSRKSGGSRFGRTARRYFIPLLISGGISVCSLLCYVFTFLTPTPSPAFEFLKDVEAKTLDIRFRLRGVQKPGPALAIVAIDQRSEDILGRWPFPRSVFAETLDVLHAAHARVVAFDINFPEPDENSALQTLRKLKATAGNNPALNATLTAMEASADNDQKLGDAISRFGNAILGYFFLFDPTEATSQNKSATAEFLNYLSFQSYPQVLKPKGAAEFDGLDAIGLSPDLPKFAVNAKNFGFFNVAADTDGVVRTEPVVIRYAGSYYPSLDVATALAFSDAPLDKVAIVFDQGGLARVDLGKVKVPTDPWGMVRIDFHGPSGTYPTFSIADVVKHRLPAADFADKIVLIGPTATGIADTRPTPFESSAFPGVEIHANFIDNLLNGTFIQRGVRENLIDLLVIFLFSLPAGLTIAVLRPGRSAILLTGAGLAYLVIAYHEFAAGRVWLVIFLPMATLFATYSAVVSYSYFFEEREKKQVRGAFQQYMAPDVIKQVLDRPELLRLGGEEKPLTAMFADIRGFTSLSEGLTPSELVDLLNEYLSEMTEVIFDHQGTLDKYIGDAIMAFWGAPLDSPDHAERACRAALGMSAALRKLQERWISEGRPNFDIGIGINTGDMLVGNMGSARRFNYTIMGDNVNLASRLEGVTKTFGTRTIISESTFERVRETMLVRELDMIKVKGKKKPVTIYELLGPAEELASHQDLLTRFQAALTAYRAGDWPRAMELFQDLHRDYPDDGPSKTFLKRCEELIDEQPQGPWDGVFAMTTK